MSYVVTPSTNFGGDQLLQLLLETQALQPQRFTLKKPLEDITEDGPDLVGEP